MKKLILDKNAKILRQIAKPLPLKDIGSKKVGDIIAKMKKALSAEADGVAIAAPQVGESFRIFVVKHAHEDLVFINPVLVKTSRKKKLMEEGCLSVRYLYGQVKRHEKVTIKALDEKGTSRVRGASGLLSQIFQHELDHLDGILFIDKAENIRNIPPTQNEA